MKKVYFYEIGCCRGDQFSNKVSLPLELVMSFITQILEVKNKDERYQLIDKLSDELFSIEGDDNYYNFQRAKMAVCLVDVDGFFCHMSDDDIKQRQIKLQNSQRFGIELEESSIGIGLSKDDAKIAYSEIATNENDEWI